MSKRKAETSLQSDSDEYSEDNYENSVNKEDSENGEDMNLSHDGKYLKPLESLIIYDKKFIQYYTHIPELPLNHLATFRSGVDKQLA